MVAIAPAALGNNSIRASLVTRLEQLVQIFAVRAIWLMEDEERLPFNQAYDGNDLQATHVVLYDGEEPVGAVRLRWFGNFAKAERFVIRRSHRGGPASKVLADFVFEHVARKGYRRLVIHATPRVARLWRRDYGFQENSKKTPVRYDNGFCYHELVKELTVPEDAIDENTDIPILYRVEGEWDEASKFEKAS
jgi:predicted GNAT superfamily acetyltransferase